MPEETSSLYTNQGEWDEFVDASSLDEGLGTRYNWKSILPDDVYKEVNELFVDNKSPASFMKHGLFMNNHWSGDPSPYHRMSHPSNPKDMKYGDVMDLNHLGDFQEVINNGEGWAHADGDWWYPWYTSFVGGAVSEAPEHSLINSLNELGPNYFPKGSSLNDVEGWMQHRADNATFTPDFQHSTVQNWSPSNWGNANEEEHYNDGNRMWPYIRTPEVHVGYSGNNAGHFSHEASMNKDMEDTFQGGYSTGQNVLNMTDLFNPSSIGNALTEIGDLGETSYGYAPPLNMDMIRETRGQHYRPLLEASRGSAYSDYRQSLSQARSLGSGFAGYGGRDKARDRATDAYSKQIGGTMSDISKLRGDARGKIGDIINQWRQMSNK